MVSGTLDTHSATTDVLRWHSPLWVTDRGRILGNDLVVVTGLALEVAEAPVVAVMVDCVRRTKRNLTVPSR